MTIDEVRALIPPQPEGWSIEPRVMRTFKYGNVEWGLIVHLDGMAVAGNRGVYDSTMRREIRAWTDYIAIRATARNPLVVTTDDYGWVTSIEEAD